MNWEENLPVGLLEASYPPGDVLTLFYAMSRWGGASMALL